MERTQIVCWLVIDSDGYWASDWNRDVAIERYADETGVVGPLNVIKLNVSVPLPPELNEEADVHISDDQTEQQNLSAY